MFQYVLQFLLVPLPRLDFILFGSKKLKNLKNLTSKDLTKKILHLTL